MAGSYGLLQLVLRIPLGAVSDRWGRRKSFVTLAFIIISDSPDSAPHP